MDNKAGLYIHIPFCVSPCGYCDFYKVKRESVEESFIIDLIKEARLYKEEGSAEIDSIYLGGGTPSLLTPVQLKTVFGQLSEIFKFAPIPEVTMEANPETLTEEKLAGFKEAGVNRLSVGIQSLKGSTLKSLSRRASSAEINSALKMLKKTDFQHLSADLIIGAPLSSPLDVKDDLAKLLDYHFDHFSLYILELHEGTRLYEEVKCGLPLPDEEEIMESYQAAADFLKSNGFDHYEISNFSRPGCRCRHNLKYWKREWTIGLGPSAQGFFKGWRTGNPRSIEEWRKKLEKGDFPWEESFKETEREKKRK